MLLWLKGNISGSPGRPQRSLSVSGKIKAMDWNMKGEVTGPEKYWLRCLV